MIEKEQGVQAERHGGNQFLLEGFHESCSLER